MSQAYHMDRFLEKYNVRTDLALESHEVIVEHDGPPELPGVKIQTEEQEGVAITRITVENRVFDSWIETESLKVPLGAYFFVKFGNNLLRNFA